MYHQFINWYFKNIKKSGWFGDFPNWESAARACKGYDDNAIFEQVLKSARAVREGKAVFERDSVLFFEEERDESLLRALQTAADTEGGVRVLDFGGSLGSSFFQHRKWITDFTDVWCVVEQKHFVEAGKKEFENNTLKFEYTIQEAARKYKPNIILFNNVLQYLENPLTFYREGKRLLSMKYVYLGQTPWIEGNFDKITQQMVAPKIYEASYPCHIFANDGLWHSLLRGGRQVLFEEKTRYGRYLVGNLPLFFKDVLLESCDC